MIDVYTLFTGYLLGAGSAVLSAAVTFVKDEETRKMMIIASIPLLVIGFIAMFLIR